MLSPFVTSIFAVKILFIVLAIACVYTKRTHNTVLLTTLQYWKDRAEFVFVFLMSILLLYLFNPYSNHNNLIIGETKWLLYLFGIVLIVTAPWSVFIHEAPWFKEARSILG